MIEMRWKKAEAMQPNSAEILWMENNTTGIRHAVLQYREKQLIPVGGKPEWLDSGWQDVEIQDG